MPDCHSDETWRKAIQFPLPTMRHPAAQRILLHVSWGQASGQRELDSKIKTILQVLSCRLGPLRVESRTNDALI